MTFISSDLPLPLFEIGFQGEDDTDQAGAAASEAAFSGESDAAGAADCSKKAL